VKPAKDQIQEYLATQPVVQIVSVNQATPDQSQVPLSDNPVSRESLLAARQTFLKGATIAQMTGEPKPPVSLDPFWAIRVIDEILAFRVNLAIGSWVAFVDAAPTPDQDVLILGHIGGHRVSLVASWDHVTGAWYLAGQKGVKFLGTVTHWQTIPWPGQLPAPQNAWLDAETNKPADGQTVLVWTGEQSSWGSGPSIAKWQAQGCIWREADTSFEMTHVLYWQPISSPETDQKGPLT